MRSNWIKFTAIFLAVCYGIYSIYLIVLVFKEYKATTEVLAIAIPTIVLSYAIVFMLIGAIYRIGTLTDQVNYLNTKILQVQIGNEKGKAWSKSATVCPNCLSKLDGDEEYCQKCGHKINLGKEQ